MKKLHAVLSVVVVAGLFAGLMVLSGCTRSAGTGQGYQGGRHTDGGRYADSSVGADGGRRAERGGQGFARIDPQQPAGSLQAPAARGGRGSGRSADLPRSGVSRAAPAAPADGYGQGFNRGLPPGSGNVDGRSVAATGSLTVLAGNLDAEGTEWYLETPNGRYALHFGNTAYVQSTGIKLRENATVEVRGFLDASEVAVASIEIDGDRYVFRSDDGVPLWAGRGRQAGGGGGGGGGLRRTTG